MHAGVALPSLHDPMTVRRLRLGCGLVLFTYLALHLCMHALGNVSFDAMQAGTRLHDWLWHGWPGTVLLYGAFAIHFSLALYALYARRSFRMGAGEWTRLLLGFSIVPMVAGHFTAQRYAWSAYATDRHYDSVLPAYFSTAPFWGTIQVTVLLIAWTHGCLGIHFWLRQRPGYARFAPVVLAIAVLLPVLSLLGLYQGTREALALQKAPASSSYGDYGGYGASGASTYGDYGASGGSDYDGDGASGARVKARSNAVEDGIYIAYVLLVLGVFAARVVRWAIERRRGLVSITYPGGRRVRVPVGYPVLEASRSARIPHASICGGRGRCTTCRVRVLKGVESLPPAQRAEAAALERLHAGSNVRLACQLRPQSDIAVLPLLPPDVTAGDPARDRDAVSMERYVVILFVDIRRSTALLERRLPYDAVFLLNHFFDAVAGAIVEAGGAPNQFIGDGVMAIFGIRAGPRDACRQALDGVRLARERLAEMNRSLADELSSPIEVGFGVHAGHAILGEIGYRDRFLLTAIGDTVNVAARLQDLTKAYDCTLVVSQEVADTAEVDLSSQPAHEIAVRGRQGSLLVRAVS